MSNLVETTDAAAGTATTYVIGVGQSAQGHIGALGDSDWYRVELIAGHKYTFAVAGENALSANVDDPYLYFRDTAGNLIASDDDSGPSRYSSLTYTAAVTDTYYLDVQAWNNSGTGQYGLSVTEAAKAFYDTDMGAGALLTAAASWVSSPATPVTITYGFRQSAPTYTSNGHPTTQSSFSQLSAAEMAAAQTIMQQWSEFSGAHFTLVNPGGYTNNATVLFGNYYDQNDGAGAFTYFPGQTGGSASAGDAFLNAVSVSTTSLPYGSYSYFAIMHEVGHALGLTHPGDYNASPSQTITYANSAQFAQDSQQYSVMSYFDEAATGAQDSGYPDTPLLFDIYALQQLYGVDTTTRSGDTVYGFGSNAEAVYDFSINTTPALCIWDAGGNDTLNCSGFSQGQQIDLNAGAFSSIGGLSKDLSIAIGAVIENAVGGSGNDAITGNAADNTLDGRGGADAMAGGAGNDTYVVENSGDVIVENAGQGTDSVISSIGYVLGANLENLTLLGAADISGTGNAVANVIVGNSGNNTLDGMAGADAMFGGAGNDIYYVDNPGDAVVENANEGADTVFSTAHLRLAANVENLILQGSADLQGYGNALGNSIYGNSGNNLIDGDSGVDVMAGGAGSDAYVVDNISDAIVENANEGNDMVYSTVHLRLAVNVENLVLQGAADLQGYGNSLANAVYGNSGSNLIDGDVGADVMAGGAGSDVYMVDNISDTIVENANEGNDMVFSTVHLRLVANVENLVLQGNADLQGYGNSLVNAIYGNSGNNLIDGDLGADVMVGGAGNDIYIVDNISDAVIENANEGIDTVLSTNHLRLAANVENLNLKGSADLQGYGNALANNITGNAGANVLDGGAGVDVLTGGAGQDFFYFRAGEANGDTITDFNGLGAAAGDVLLFSGYGSGATFTNVDATHWQVNYGTSHDVIAFSNAATVHPSDFAFV